MSEMEPRERRPYEHATGEEEIFSKGMDGPNQQEVERLMRLPVRELKSLLDGRGIQAGQPTEKIDLVRAYIFSDTRREG